MVAEASTTLPDTFDSTSESTSTACAELDIEEEFENRSYNVVSEGICRDVWMRLRLRYEETRDEFFFPVCGNGAGLGCGEDNRMGRPWLPLCPAFRVLNALIDTLQQDRLVAALLVPDWESEEWFPKIMAFQKKRYYYAPERNVRRDNGPDTWGYWAVLVDCTQEPNYYASSSKTVRSQGAERRWRRKYTAVQLC